MKHSYLTNVTTLAYDNEKCIGCGMCVDVCPHGVFEIIEQQAHIIDRDSCMECGACVLNCPTQALDVNAGAGCATAIIISWFTGKEPFCGCADDGEGSSCC